MGVYISDNNGELIKVSGLQKNNSEQVETIYDMNDSSKDWGYSAGINNNGSSGVTISGKNFSKYRYLRVIIAGYGGIGTSWYGDSQAEVIVRLDIFRSGCYSGKNVIGAMGEEGILYSSTQIVKVNSEKTTLTYYGMNVYSNGAFGNGIICKIEGVY
jgi:hypothetical protein